MCFGLVCMQWKRPRVLLLITLPSVDFVEIVKSTDTLGLCLHGREEKMPVTVHTMGVPIDH